MADSKGNTFILGIVQTCVTYKEKGSNLLERKAVQGMILLWFPLLQSYSTYQHAGQSHRVMTCVTFSYSC